MKRPMKRLKIIMVPQEDRHNKNDFFYLSVMKRPREGHNDTELKLPQQTISMKLCMKDLCLQSHARKSKNRSTVDYECLLVDRIRLFFDIIIMAVRRDSRMNGRW